MKLSVTLSASQPEKRLFFQIGQMKRLGYEGVDLAVRNPKDLNLKNLLKLTENSNLKICSITTGQAFSEDNLSFSSPEATVREKAIQRIKEQINFASNFGAKVLIGWIRGNWLECGDFKKAKKWFVVGMRECNKLAREMNVELVIEPINRYEIDSLHTIRDAINLIKEANLKNVGVAADLFHMNIEEVSIIESLQAAAKENLLSIIHIADSNRLAPGRGHLDFKEIFKTLSEIGYKGFLSLEIFPPQRTFFKETKFAINYLKRLNYN